MFAALSETIYLSIIKGIDGRSTAIRTEIIERDH
jgi:hypothetical protein